MKNGVQTLKVDTQLSVSLVNKPGLLAQVCQRLAEDHVNILALSMMDRREHSVLRLVVAEPENARRALTALDLPTTETHVLLATMPNRPGALADVVERLATAHIGVSYAYCTSGAPGGKTLGIFKVSDPNKAMKVLSERKPRRKEAPTAIRSNGRGRRM